MLSISATFHAETMCRRESGLVLQDFDDLGDLVDVPAVGRGPGAPLDAVDGTQLAVGVGPFVPDLHAALLQPAHVGVAAQEPEQLQRHRLEVHALGGDQREAFGQVEADLAPEDAAGAGAGAVALGGAVGQHVAQQVLIRGGNWPVRWGRGRRRHALQSNGVRRSCS